MTSEKTWALNRQLTIEKTHGPANNTDSLRKWNNEGLLIKTEQTVGGSRAGEWMVYDPEIDQKELTTYENGKIQSTTSFRNNNLYSREFYKDGHPSKLVTYYLNGETATELIHLGLGKLQHASWSQNQSKTEDCTTQDDYLLGEGHYAVNDSTTAFFKAPKAINPLIPVIRVIITNSDTIQKDYVKKLRS